MSKNVEEARDLVAEARARINAQKEAARELAEAESVVAAEDARQRAEERKAELQARDKAFDDAVAEYETLRDDVLAEAVAYLRRAQQAAAALDLVRQAQQQLNFLIRPQGYLLSQDEEPYDRNKPAEALALVADGDVSDPVQREHKVSDQELGLLRILVSAVSY
jgi:hypothetical protein